MRLRSHVLTSRIAIQPSDPCAADADGYFYLMRPPGERLMAHQSWTKSAVESLGWGDDAKKLVSEGRDNWLHLMAPYSHNANQSVGGHVRWQLPTDQKVMSVDPEFLPDQPDVCSLAAPTERAQPTHKAS